MGSLSILGISRRVRTIRGVIFMSIALTALIVGATFSLTKLAPNAAAATPPDSCFAFDAVTGTITNYYDHEGDDASNPACPKSVDIPSTIGGVTVTSIGTSALQAKSLSSVTLPATLTSIGQQAFWNNSLASVVIPSLVTSIGASAFGGNQLSSVTLPNSLASIGGYAFAVNKLTSVVIPDSVTSMGDNAFSDNELTSVEIGSSLAQIPRSAFTMNNLTSVTIPSTVTEIGEDSFSRNRLESITIPASVTSVGTGAFGVNNITSVTLEGTPTLGSAVFITNGPEVSIEDYEGALSQSWDAALQYLIDHSSYVPVYTDDISYLDSVYTEQGIFGFDINGDGIDSAIGGHVINRPQLTVKYLSEAGDKIAPTMKRVGMSLNNYIVASNPEADLTQYYQPNEQVTVEPQPISGYSAPAPQMRTLAAGPNVVSFVYTAADDSSGGEPDPGNSSGGAGQDGNNDGASDGIVPGVPNTGATAALANHAAFTPAVAVVIAMIAAVTLFVMRRRLAKR